MRLGEKVKIKGHYQRNGRKPQSQHGDNIRYSLTECDKEGFIVGKRNIHFAGYTDYDSDIGYYFCSQRIVTCWLVAVSMGQCLYVPLDKVESIDEEIRSQDITDLFRGTVELDKKADGCE
ncbi:MAG: hypothetical protein PHU31_11620 [Anaerotignum sp.]|nr:hypothetical protein [Anaerotignum sp.]